MKKSVVILSALFALVSLSMVSGAEEETESSTEVPVQKVHVLNPGEKEYLSPNLIGLQNIAVTNIPVSINFVNIIDAFREVVDGVKYEIVLNAVNTTDNNAEIVCRIVVLEKPWLTTLWGDKVRLLKESNCTSEELLDNTRDRKSIEEKYETNAIFTGNRNELTADDMNKLESQILDSPKNPQLRRQPSLSSPTITTTTTESIVSDDVPKPVNTQTEGEQGVVSVSAAIEDDVVLSSTEPSITTTTTTTTEKLPELSNDEKKWLDDFLSIGAYNFEVSQQKTPENQNNEEQLNDQESAKRFARQIVGGPRQLNADELKTEEENLAKSLSKIATGDGPSYTIDKVYSGTTQVVAGSLVKLDADLIESQTGEKNRCIVSLWSQPWLKQDGYEVTFECKDKPKSVHRHSRSANERPGGVRQLNEEDLKSEQENLAKSLSKIAAGVGPSYTIDKVYSGTIQVVSGHLVKLDADLIEGQTGEKNRCIVSLWSQPWLKQNGYEVTLECKDKPKIVQRHSRSVEVSSRSKRSLVGVAKELDEENLKTEVEKVNESLTKLAAGEGPFYTISKVFRGTKRIVAGTLVTIDAELVDGISGEKENCTVSLWSRLWIPVDGQEVTFECGDKPKSVHRHSRSVDRFEKKSHKKSHHLNKSEYLFQKFQIKYNKTYHNSMEHQMRLRIFKHNLRLIMDLNKHEMGSAKYGITEFADMTTTEYRERTGLLPREETNAVRSQAVVPEVQLPKEFDWREKGVVSPVKNQGNCGSCWAFSVTGNIEGLHAVKTGKLEEYSEQELLDCDTIDSACQGGLPDNAYQAIEKIGGLELESEYPYEGRKGKCHYNSSLTRVKVSGAVDLPKNETAMAQWLITNGPISIGINANAMQFYRGGVSHPWKLLCSKANLDHGVLIVGYGVSDYPMFKKTLPYWIVKNSWGPKWGEQGYYRVYRGDNTCGVSEMASSAILA